MRREHGDESVSPSARAGGNPHGSQYRYRICLDADGEKHDRRQYQSDSIRRVRGTPAPW